MTVASLVFAVAVAAVGPLLDQAAGELRRDPVYVSPDADPARSLSEGDASELRRRIGSAERPVFVAVLPDAAADEAGGLDRLPTALGEATGLRGTYAVVTGRGFRAASNDLPAGVAGSLATSAFQAERDNGTAAVLGAFVARVDTFAGDGGGSEAPATETPPSGDGGSSVLPLLLVGGAVGGGLWAMSRRRREVAATRAALEGDREDLRAELAVLADDVMRLEDDVAISPDARDDYEAGVARYRWAQVAIDAVDSPDDVPRVRRALAEGAYAMARARAIVRGDAPPPPPAELTRPGPYGEPAVELDDERRPVYAGFGGGWGGGGFFGGNGLFAGILLGQMLGGGFGWGGGWGHGGGSDGGGDGGSVGGDLGGGDWGGGDFGGGDVGGGNW